MSQLSKTKLLKFLVALVAISSPAIVLAAPKTFKELIGTFIFYVQLVIPVVIGLSILFFFWGITKFIFAAGNEEKVKEGKNIMTWGLLALFVTVSILAIIAMVGGSIFPNFNTRIDTQFGPIEGPYDQNRAIGEWQEGQDSRYREGTI